MYMQQMYILCKQVDMFVYNTIPHTKVNENRKEAEMARSANIYITKD
jgi:hypothetical protein